MSPVSDQGIPQGSDDFHGPLVIGYGASAFLFGVITLKTATYFRSYGNADPRGLKGTILAVWILELAHSCIACAISYLCLVKTPGLANGPPQALTLFAVNGVVSVLITSIVQGYSAYRLRIITGSIWVPCIIGAFSTIRTIIFLTGTVVQVGPFPYLQVQKWKGVMIVVGVLAILTDTLLAASLGFALWMRRKEFKILRDSLSLAGNRTSSRLFQTEFDRVDELIFFCIGGNVSTSLTMIVVFVLYHVEKNLIWLPISYVQTRMYALSFIALVLESRRPPPSIIIPSDLIDDQIACCRIGAAPSLSPLPERTAQTIRSANSTTPNEQLV